MSASSEKLRPVYFLNFRQFAEQKAGMITKIRQKA